MTSRKKTIISRGWDIPYSHSHICRVKMSGLSLVPNYRNFESQRCNYSSASTNSSSSLAVLVFRGIFGTADCSSFMSSKPPPPPPPVLSIPAGATPLFVGTSAGLSTPNPFLFRVRSFLGVARLGYGEGGCYTDCFSGFLTLWVQ